MDLYRFVLMYIRDSQIRRIEIQSLSRIQSKQILATKHYYCIDYQPTLKLKETNHCKEYTVQNLCKILIFVLCIIPILMGVRDFYDRLQCFCAWLLSLLRMPSVGFGILRK